MAKKNSSRPVDMMPSREIDGEDYELLMAMENGEIEFERIPNHDEFAKKLQKGAADYFKKDARVSFRISPTDLNNIKRMAASEGLPYQTYLTSIIHKLTTGQLVPSAP